MFFSCWPVFCYRDSSWKLREVTWFRQQTPYFGRRSHSEVLSGYKFGGHTIQPFAGCDSIDMSSIFLKFQLLCVCVCVCVCGQSWWMDSRKPNLLVPKVLACLHPAGCSRTLCPVESKIWVNSICNKLCPINSTLIFLWETHLLFTLSPCK